MSDLDDYTALLDRTGVVYECNPAPSPAAKGFIFLTIAEGEGPKNSGYTGFHTLLSFNPEGELVYFGAWE